MYHFITLIVMAIILCSSMCVAGIFLVNKYIKGE